jgi:hypothetical protein
MSSIIDLSDEQARMDTDNQSNFLVYNNHNLSAVNTSK